MATESICSAALLAPVTMAPSPLPFLPASPPADDEAPPSATAKAPPLTTARAPLSATAKAEPSANCNAHLSATARAPPPSTAEAPSDATGEAPTPAARSPGHAPGERVAEAACPLPLSARPATCCASCRPAARRILMTLQRARCHQGDDTSGCVLRGSSDHVGPLLIQLYGASRHGEWGKKYYPDRPAQFSLLQVLSKTPL